MKEEAQNRFIEFGYVEEMDPTTYAKIEEDLWNTILKGKQKDQKTSTDDYQIPRIIGDIEIRINKLQ